MLVVDLDFTPQANLLYLFCVACSKDVIQEDFQIGDEFWGMQPAKMCPESVLGDQKSMRNEE